MVDLTEQLDDPVDVLFGVQLGGGTDINRRHRLLPDARSPGRRTRVLVLITDLYEGGVARGDARAGRPRARRPACTVVALLALSDEGAPAYDHEHAAALAALGVPAFACTPDLFPDLLAVALRGGDIGAWVSSTQLAPREG